MKALEKQYGTEKVGEEADAGKKIGVSFVAGVAGAGETADIAKTKNVIKVEYKGKQRSGGDVSYTVNVEGVVSKGA